MLDGAKRRIEVEGIEYDLNDPRVIQLEELMKNPSFFPAIEPKALGKVSGDMIKALLSNFNDKESPKKGHQ